MSELSRSVLPFESLTNNKNLLYFTALDSDERLEALLETGTSSVDIDCHGTTRYPIHPTLLPENSITDSGIETAYTALGYIDRTNNAQTFRLHLKANAGETPRDCIIEQLGDGLIVVYSNENPDFIETISQEEFFNLSMRAADMKPLEAEEAFNNNSHEENVSAAFKLWEIASLHQNGYYSTHKTVSHLITGDPLNPVEIRFDQSETEYPDKSCSDLIIEHVTQLRELDAQIIYRLELSYEDRDERSQGFSAHKRVVSGCDRTLSRVKLSTEDADGIVTKLDINDKAVMKQFRVATELALQSLS